MSSYIPIASQTLSSNQATVTFSSIPTSLLGKNLRDLVLVAEGVATGDNIGMTASFNSDSGSNYSSVTMQGNGSTAASSAPIGQTSLYVANNAAFAASGRAIVATLSVFDFAQTNKHKSTLTRSNAINASSGGTEAVAGRWASTSAITSLSVNAISGNGHTFAVGSTFSLYGIEG
jgi:hypothetical protein